MNNNPMAPKEDYKSIIFSGCAIESNGISICNINDFIQPLPRRGPRYQVWSDRHRVYELYHNIDEAVDKFLDLKERS